jgi:signal transduction histidine kinase
MLVHGYAELPDGMLEQSLHTVAASARKLNTIVDELLLLASVRQVEEIETYPLDMARIVGGARGRLRYLIEELGGEVALPDSWPVAMGYEPWVEEVWTNYLSNALKYGGRPPRVELGYARNPAFQGIRFWVRDNGLGLSAEEQERLFTPFERLHQVRVKGHGLGLSIVRRIVHRLDGQVGVDCEAGQGCTFFFTLPAAPV